MEGFSAVALIAGAPHPKEAERLLRFLMSARTEATLAAGPAQTVGLLPGSVARDVRPAWLPRKIRAMDVDWDRAARDYPESMKAMKEILFGR
jgi:iron(III) transport system substrate-binding protein